ncbi:hypothetical protein LINPERHAP1_LOCUS37303, partial [Linum perenne]
MRFLSPLKSKPTLFKLRVLKLELESNWNGKQQMGRSWPWPWPQVVTSTSSAFLSDAKVSSCSKTRERW